ncbi:MAG: hypothetical protein JW705_10090 [Methanosarcinaceae archaeon]|nr:hypothetical protein [Methanosarcinaceae archaeon]
MIQAIETFNIVYQNTGLNCIPGSDRRYSPEGYRAFDLLDARDAPEKEGQFFDIDSRR